ncbi:hypothetical protein GCM10010387_26690 [Streptomyces inusitatus]|uniref:DUF1996 domain-containing protein n=1 Tax=Streptomyces inusitatus TaxID=68221 RepID=A0A918Q2P4_9ACTN|nr:hypothetical protein GCM10010387_26690 [Streptomyces inusitatus]
MQTPPLLLTLCLTLVIGVVVVLTATESGSSPGSSPVAGEYAELADFPVASDPPPGPDASTGVFTEECGRNERGQYNTDNVVTSPGIAGGAHHTHDYVGNTSTNALSTDRSLAAADTTCANGDLSTYFWPVLRRLDRAGTDGDTHGGGGVHGNTGEILTPSSVRLEYRGSPVSRVIPMPRFLRMVTGDPVAATAGDARVRAQWGCSGHPGRFTVKYPVCPAGHGPTRTLDFPSCWNGLHTDSEGHRGHVAFPGAGGSCPAGTFPVPRLRITLSYELPYSVPFALDSFPAQKRHPKTDHAMFINVMTERQQSRLTACLNEGRRCGADS